ncbi:Valyl-tRNA synthetase [Candidatus Saccharibacteria bacterium RAAC3_TM7_1]|nr:Valyl-tRNA synthetase [Candidatus Saccharibacteria bacterium RAAC3_TM7_1]HCZ28300.1 valine--tRNA ligase [Candidatus Saccharibacteria bacterium]
MKLPKAYQPNDYEPTIYALWEKSGAFAPTGVGEPYAIVMPPPNANGNLHIGHSLMTSVEDILVRFYRMKGRDTVYIPGADHAGFETWVVYEKELEKKGQSRFDFSRGQLYSQVWDFVDQTIGNMELQLRALGVSASWDNLVFSLDEKVTKTAYQTFKKLWDEGLLYRGERIVNYCTVHQTSFSDIEVEHKMEKGKLYKIAYPTIDKIGEIVIATTRPETMLGDVAVAVHPEDERYKGLIGSHVLLPLTDREVPIIADEYVDREFGTGAVKITPAHDPNDFEIGKRHNLPELQVIDFDNTMINVPAQFSGLTSVEARKRVLAALQAEELLRGEEEIEHAVGHCYKCGSIIQPLIKDQWFLNMKPLADAAREVINRGEIRFVPESKQRDILQYLENIRDWNLSRQIPWGIPIPAFQNIADANDWIYDERVDETTLTIDGKTYRREEDTFDTWFSSGQWPFITTDYLTEGGLSRFYPISVMETGHDILYPWVARMIMLGLKVTGKVPFKDVYLHGLVLDEHGQKMSKSKGNVINPIEIVSEYGSDALRLGLVAARSAGQNQAFSTSKVVAGRNFCNKLWNIARFTEDKLGEHYKMNSPEPASLADHWIIHELTSASTEVESLLTDYRFAEAAELVYHTVWSSVADWYIEASKHEQNHDMLAWVLDTVLRLAHPFAPFVTETIWQTLPWYADGTMVIQASWPTHTAYDEIAAAEFERLQQLVSEIRFVTSELPGNKKYTVEYGQDSLIEDNRQLIQSLARLVSLERTEQPRGLRLATSGREAWLVIDEKTLYEHQTNLEVRLAEAKQLRDTLEKRLGNESYVQKAPAHLVEETAQARLETTALIERLEAELTVITSV